MPGSKMITRLPCYVGAEIPQPVRGEIQALRDGFATPTAGLPVEITLLGSSGTGPIPAYQGAIRRDRPTVPNRIFHDRGHLGLRLRCEIDALRSHLSEAPPDLTLNAGRQEIPDS